MRKTREARAILLHSNIFPEQPKVLASNTFTRRSYKVGETGFSNWQYNWMLTRIEVAPSEFNGIDILLYFHNGLAPMEFNLTYSGLYTIDWVYGENHE